MCGIVGWCNLSRDISGEKSIVEEMTKALSHRGPDDDGYYISSNVLFGHRRLSIMDPEKGAQPMEIVHKGNSYVIVYNGELYNAGEIKKSLTLLGHSFDTNCDTEVVLRSYIEFEEDCCRLFNGIFAFAIFDMGKNKVFLARDHFGVKPLFYHFDGRSLFFSSEIKGLLKHPQITPRINKNSIAQIFLMGPARIPGSGVFENISELLPANYISFDGNLQMQEYYRIRALEHKDDFEDTSYKVKVLLEDSIKRQLVSDVGISSFLSGGLDSTIITAVAARELKSQGERLKTFSLEFKGNEKNFTSGDFQGSLDTPWIVEASQYYQTDHEFISQSYSSEENMADFLKISMLARDLPGMGDIDSSLYFFCKEVKKQRKVALSGECADEIFGGYPWFYRETPQKLGDGPANFPWNGNFDLRKKVLRKEILEQLHADEYVQNAYEEMIRRAPILPDEPLIEQRKKQLHYINFYYFMANLLERKDRMSMYTGLEVRVPFCDPWLLEYVYNIPWGLKYFGNVEKAILRSAFKDQLPESIYARKKNPYPKTYDPKFDKTARILITEILENPNSKISAIVDVDYIKSLIKDVSNPSLPWYGQLMDLSRMFTYLVQIEQWLSHYQINIKI